MIRTPGGVDRADSSGIADDPSTSHLLAQRRLTSLLEANQVIVGELSLAAVLRRIVEAAREVVGARYAALGVIGTDGELEEFVHAGMDEATVEAIGTRPRGRGLLGALISDPRPVRVKTMTEDPRSTGMPVGAPAMQSFIGIPVQGREAVFGHLYLTDRRDGGEFSAEDEEIVRALATTASIAIENARLYEESRRRQEWLRASAEIARDLVAGDVVSGDVLVRIADSVRRLSDADVVSITFDEGDRMTVRVARGHRAEELLGFSYPVAGTLAGDAVRHRQATLIDSPDTERYFVHLRNVIDVGPVMACPLLGEREPRAAVVVGRVRGRRAFSQQDLDMVETFATQAALALELADRRVDQTRLAMLEDRHRIARDLHDHAIQRLFATGLGLESTAALMRDANLATRLRRSVDDLDETIREIREAIFELQNEHRPEQSTLREVVLAVIDELTGPLGFRPDVTFRGPLDTIVDDDLGHDVVAVVREGLTNVVRHADARRCGVELAVDGTTLTVVIADDGPRGPRLRPGHGVSNLRARAASRCGTMTVKHDEEGTVLRWAVSTTG